MQLSDYRVEIVEHPIGELLLPEFIPHMFLRVELWGIRRQRNKSYVFRPLEFLRLV